jgi:PAS domain S-box-containing protein
MPRSTGSPNFAVYRTVGEAAEFLGVSRATLRNWDRSGKLKARRHPKNGYRIYLHGDLESLLLSADFPTLAEDKRAPQVSWDSIGEREHFVQFYEADDYLVDSLTAYVAAGLRAGQASVVIATPEHRAAISRKLAANDVDSDSAISSGSLVLLDAAETLAKILVDGLPDRALFLNVIGRIIAEVSRQSRGVRAFGEMVALLWMDERRDAAIQLESLWNELGEQHPFSLFCAYPLTGFSAGQGAAHVQDVCGCHSRVIPGESYGALEDEQTRLRAITLLQLKAQSLEAEIAHRQEVERLLVARERELSDFFENAIEGLHKVGPDGKILWANKAECELLGYPLDEVVGRPISDFHADQDTCNTILEKRRGGETLHNFPARLLCKNGEIKHVLISLNVCFEDGEFAYTRCFTRDVTRQWQAEHALREANRRKDEFLALLAHELRNPLAPVRNALELIKVNGRDEQVIAEARGIMERQVTQMTRLVDDLLDISRITRDKLELRKERVELAAVLKNAIETSLPIIEEAGHQLHVELPDEELYLQADPVRMAQVFANLLNNAAKYTPAGGNIRIRAENRSNEALVSVRDDGVGIACDALAHVFDMFRQLDGSLERAQGGLGIGLTLVRRLVELHDGTVNVQSEGLGKGSEFTVRLPLAQRNTDRVAEREPAARPSPKRRVLVVDDNHDSGDSLCLLLKTKGHDVRTARDGLEAIAAAREFKPEIILMDVGMPNLNGYDATRRIRETDNGRDIFIVALTGWGQAEDVQHSREAGCSAHLIKPVNFAALDRLLAEWESSRG